MYQRSTHVAVVLGLVLTMGSVAPATADPMIESGHLKGEELLRLVGVEHLALLGFSWGGEVRLFADGLDLEVVAPSKKSDVRFQLAARGPVSTCEKLRRLAAEGTPLGSGRLSFKDRDGGSTTLRLKGVAVIGADCGTTPWIASLGADKVRSSPADAKGRRPKKQRQDLRPTDVGGG